MTQLHKKEITGEGTYIEFETPYVVVHSNYIFDSSERKQEATSLKIEDLPFLGPNVKAITFELIKTRRASVGDQTIESSKPIKSKKLSGIAYVNAELWDEERTRQKSKKGQMRSNLRILHNSDTGFLVKMRNNYLLPFRENDMIVSWYDDDSEKGGYYKQVDQEFALGRALRND